MLDNFGSSLPLWFTLLPPALIVFVISIVLELVQWVGFSLISTWLFNAYRFFFHRDMYKKLKLLQSECVQIKRQLHATSSMDEFAKWARLRRQLDAKSAQYDRLTSEANTTKLWFQIKSQLVTRPMFYLTYTYLIYIYRGTPMFYIPRDWFNLLGDFMYFPLAPFGSVSVVLWMVACRRFVRNIISKPSEVVLHKKEQ